MGRLRTWIERAFQAPRRCDLGGAVRRRKLAFECCESRLALSAATGTPDHALALGNVALNDALGGQLIFLDGAQYSGRYDLNFNVPAGADRLFSAIPLSPEGGVIGLDSIAANDTLILNSFDPASTAIDAAFSDGGHATSLATTSFNADVQTRASFQFDGVDSGSSWHFFKPGAWSDRITGNGTNINLGGTGLHTGSDVQLDDTKLADAGGVRVITPPQQAPSEGGAIDLAAMLAPESLLGSRTEVRLVASRTSLHRSPSPLAAEAAPLRQSMPIESLRARAVVVNVALAEDVDAKASDDEPATPLADALEGQAPAAARHRDAIPPTAGAANHRAPRAHHAIATDAAEQAAAERASTPAATASESAEAPAVAPSADAVGAAAYDAAFGELASDAPSADLAVGQAFSAARERKALGLAAAIVIGAGPLVRRARRAKPTTMVEQK
jgi:hypothetical protein